MCWEETGGHQAKARPGFQKLRFEPGAAFLGAVNADFWPRARCRSRRVSERRPKAPGVPSAGLEIWVIKQMPETSRTCSRSAACLGASAARCGAEEPAISRPARRMGTALLGAAFRWLSVRTASSSCLGEGEMLKDSRTPLPRRHWVMVTHGARLRGGLCRCVPHVSGEATPQQGAGLGGMGAWRACSFAERKAQ